MRENVRAVGLDRIQERSDPMSAFTRWIAREDADHAGRRSTWENFVEAVVLREFDAVAVIGCDFRHAVVVRPVDDVLIMCATVPSTCFGADHSGVSQRLLTRN